MLEAEDVRTEEYKVSNKTNRIADSIVPQRQVCPPNIITP